MAAVHGAQTNLNLHETGAQALAELTYVVPGHDHIPDATRALGIHAARAVLTRLREIAEQASRDVKDDDESNDLDIAHADGMFDLIELLTEKKIPTEEAPHMSDDRKIARSAAGAALLFHVSRRGGSSGSGIDEARAEAVAKKINGPELLALLEDAALRGGEDAERAASESRYRIVEEVRRLAKKSDSLALHLFIEKEAARDDH